MAVSLQKTIPLLRIFNVKKGFYFVFQDFSVDWAG